jgi:hypothetical protein
VSLLLGAFKQFGGAILLIDLKSPTKFRHAKMTRADYLEIMYHLGEGLVRVDICQIASAQKGYQGQQTGDT